jgi:hypothetical protein
MKVHCAWCEKAGRDPFMGEKEPLHDPSVSHGLCQRCLEEMTQQQKLVSHGSSTTTG